MQTHNKQGPRGTPYSDGLFFFDIQLPSDYPEVPPRVYYHAHGDRLNPNLYENGKVCLSLLGTWAGSSVESW
jgi:ubiquitin-conjugating enzyme E2 O